MTFESSDHYPHSPTKIIYDVWTENFVTSQINFVQTAQFILSLGPVQTGEKTFFTDIAVF